MSLIKKPFELKVQPSIKVLIYGQPGLRKTTLALSAPAPLLLDFDNGVHRVDPRHQTNTVQVTKWEDIQEILTEDLRDYKTLIIDTAGKMLDFMSTYIIMQNPKMGRNGSLTLQGYGERKGMFNTFLKTVSQLGKHLVFVAHEREEKEGDQKIIRPEIGGSSSGDLIKELDLVGYMQSVGNMKTISFEPCEKFYGKNTCKLPPTISLANTIEDNKPNDQLAVIFGTYANSIEEKKLLAADYSELIEVIRGKVESITNASIANEVSAWAVEYSNHIWDSKLQAGMGVRDKAKELKLILDKETKQFKDPIIETENGIASESAESKSDSKTKKTKVDAKQPELIQA